MAMRKPGPFAALSIHYYDDDKIMEAGELAEVLYVRMLAYAASQPEKEGWISDRVIMSRLGILPFDAGTDAGTDAGNDAGTDAGIVTGIVTGTDAGSRAEKLREVGLLSREGCGYRITSWLRWNRSIEEMGKERRRDRDRKNAVTSTSDGNDAGTDAGIPHQIRADRSDQIRSVGADRETSPADAADGQTGDAADAAFTAWWSHVPKKVGRGQAKKAFKTALKKTDQQTLTDAMDAYAASVKDSDPKFIAHPATWLNGERWDDEPPKPQQQPQLKDVEYWG